MKKLAVIAITGTALALAGTAAAVPLLQLDASPSTYLWGDEETITATSDAFALYALLSSSTTADPNDPGDWSSGKFQSSMINGDIFRLSVALEPALTSNGKNPQPPLPDFGSFTINSIEYNSSSAFMYGTPPASDTAKDLGAHSMYETYYLEFEFKFDPTLFVDQYNSQDNPGGYGTASDGSNNDLYSREFSINTAGLSEDYFLHFDLYSSSIYGKCDKRYFAPYSHDAQSGGEPVPEPATMLLFGTGLIGIAGFCKRRKKNC